MDFHLPKNKRVNSSTNYFMIDDNQTNTELRGCCWFLGEWGGVELLRY
jgi:hypothetical protein